MSRDEGWDSLHEGIPADGWLFSSDVYFGCVLFDNYEAPGPLFLSKFPLYEFPQLLNFHAQLHGFYHE